MSCHDGSEIPDEVMPSIRALCTDILEPVRSKFGRPIVVVSGYRSPDWNKRVGGAAKSTHVTGMGADIRPVSMSDVKNLNQCVKDMLKNNELPRLGGFGEYSKWIHVDIRHKPANGHVARWTGSKFGNEVA